VNVRRLCWLGIASADYDRMLAFLRDVMGMRVEFERTTTTEFSVPSGDRVQVFSSGHRYYDLFEGQARGPVPLFEVDDVRGALHELEGAGIDVVGSIEHDEAWEWINFIAPDGNLYEIASRRR
jgi:catechol 2,3-dioxygenase-like lactoylglutathione lyase family enzyme